MPHFRLITPNGDIIRFQCYTEEAPITSEAFLKALPLPREWYHAKTSGEEIWIADAPVLDIIQENASVFPEPGEVVIGPKFPDRNIVSGFMGIFYGKGQGLDCGNIFACVVEADLEKLKQLGESIWQNGSQALTIEADISIRQK